jgi:hypothetical protein
MNPLDRFSFETGRITVPFYGRERQEVLMPDRDKSLPCIFLSDFRDDYLGKIEQVQSSLTISCRKLTRSINTSEIERIINPEKLEICIVVMLKILEMEYDERNPEQRQSLKKILGGHRRIFCCKNKDGETKDVFMIFVDKKWVFSSLKKFPNTDTWFEGTQFFIVEN